MSEQWYLLQSGPGAADWNMALDEALLEAAARLNRPLLRFYGWTGQAASFGYSQKFSTVKALTGLRPLVRRPTGGGLVPHDADWTYSLVFPPAHWWYELRAIESYQRVHEWIHNAFAKLNVTTELASVCHKELPGQCFAGFEKSDVLWRGRKIAGAAQRRNRHGLLIQGSVQPSLLSLAKADWQQIMCDAAGLEYGVRWAEPVLDMKLRERVDELVRSKYSLAGYNERR